MNLKHNVGFLQMHLIKINDNLIIKNNRKLKPKKLQLEEKIIKQN